MTEIANDQRMFLQSLFDDNQDDNEFIEMMRSLEEDLEADVFEWLHDPSSEDFDVVPEISSLLCPVCQASWLQESNSVFHCPCGAQITKKVRNLRYFLLLPFSISSI